MDYTPNYQKRPPYEMPSPNRFNLWVKIGIPIAVILFFWIFFLNMISPGYVGVVVNLFHEDKATQYEQKGVGLHWIPLWKKLYKFPVFQQNITWTGYDGFTFQTSEGMKVNADMGITFHLQEDKIHLLFAKYRRGMNEIADTFVYNYMRDAINKSASRFKIDSLYGEEKQDFFEMVENNLRNDLQDHGIIVDRIYLVDNLHFPSQVTEALNAKIEATQRAEQRENELREAKAQAEKDVAKAQGQAQSRILYAKAEAEANLTIAKSLTAELVRYEAIKKWDGVLPKFTGDSVPLISFEEGKK